MIFCSICGMIITESNYKLNNAAFLKPNESLDNILYCPFCGAAKVFMENKEINLEIDSNNLDDETKIVLDHAMKLEVFNGEFYRTAAKLAKDKDVSNLFKALSNIEYAHAAIHKKLGGFDKLPILNKIDYSKYDTDKELLRQAEIREKHAIAYYENNMDKVCQKIANIFKVLITVESDHMTLTSKH